MRAGAAILGMSCLAVGLPVAGQSLTQDEALALAFPAADTIERRTAYLDDAQLERAVELAGSGVEIASGVVTYYIAVSGGQAQGVAYFDPHRVRTLPEVLMFIVDPTGRIRRTEVVRFAEPAEYRAPEGWFEQLEGRALDDALSLKGEIHNLTGATLTATAATGAARRVLALHAVIVPFGSSAVTPPMAQRPGAVRRPVGQSTGGPTRR